jgi:cephalosporin-C deacetylase-like acetyl esterase
MDRMLKGMNRIGMAAALMLWMVGDAALTVGADLPPVGEKRDWRDWFAVPDFQMLPPNVEVLSRKTADGVTTTEFYMAGAPFNGKPTKIYAFYSRPEKKGKYPAVLELHGAVYRKLSPDATIGYAKNGFCCLAIEWFGQTPQGQKPREPPFSLYDSPGKMVLPLPRQKKQLRVAVDPNVDGIRNGVMFVRRATMFLKSRPEVDSERLCIAGGSAGAYLTLLVLGVEPSFKAAAVKYGCGFARDLPGYFGGFFGPLVLCRKEGQDAWLAVLDPKHGIANYQAKVLLVSGTDDIFFRMPLVLKTYRAIPTEKRLLMFPNDNHSQVRNWQMPLRYFQAAFGQAPAWPSVEVPSAKTDGDKLILSVKASGCSGIAKLSFWIKRMPRAIFWFGTRAKGTPGENVKWNEVRAARIGKPWVTAIPAPDKDEQIVAYALVEDKTGVKVSSDTVEVPVYPKWRGLSDAP